MLEVQDITFSYQKNGNQILEHVNLSVGPEERLGILAPSGYGKTTPVSYTHLTLPTTPYV